MITLATPTVPSTDVLQGLIESQSLRIEMLRAQIDAFQALAGEIQKAQQPAMTDRGRRPRRILQKIPA
jgi:hypothetical protein